MRGYADLYMVTDVGEVLIDTLVAGDSFGEAVSNTLHLFRILLLKATVVHHLGLC